MIERLGTRVRSGAEDCVKVLLQVVLTLLWSAALGLLLPLVLLRGFAEALVVDLEVCALLGLAAGGGARLILRRRTLLLQLAAASAGVLLGLGLLGFLSSGRFGLLWGGGAQVQALRSLLAGEGSLGTLLGQGSGRLGDLVRLSIALPLAWLPLLAFRRRRQPQLAVQPQGQAAPAAGPGRFSAAGVKAGLQRFGRSVFTGSGSRSGSRSTRTAPHTAGPAVKAASSPGGVREKGNAGRKNGAGMRGAKAAGKSSPKVKPSGRAAQVKTAPRSKPAGAGRRQKAAAALKVKARSQSAGKPAGQAKAQRAPRKMRARIALNGSEEHRCPYCLEEVQEHDARGIHVCPVCHTWHHADCWDVTGTCQVPHKSS